MHGERIKINKLIVSLCKFVKVPKNRLKFSVRNSWYATPVDFFCHCVWIYSTLQASIVYLVTYFKPMADHNSAYCLSSHLQAVSRGTKVQEFDEGMLLCLTISLENTFSLITALFCVITLRIVIISYHHLGQTIDPILRVFMWTLRMGTIGCPKTSAQNYHYSLFNYPLERSSQLLRSRSLKSHTYSLWCDFCNSKIIFATSLIICYSCEILKHAWSELLKFVCDLQLLGI